ncbi:MAG: helix-turn-helix domain-containing protein [Chloroflexota bacterium]
MKTQISTSQVPQRESFTFWNDFICDVFVRLNSQRLDTAPFSGGVSFFGLDKIGFATVYSSPVEVSRSKPDIAQTSKSYFKISFQLEGVANLEQGGRKTILSPGDWAFYDCTQPYKLRFPQTYKQLVLKVPHTHLLGQIPVLEDLTATKVSGQNGMATLARNLIVDTENQFDGLPNQNHAQVSNTILSLLIASINSNLSGQQLNRDQKDVWRIKVKNYIDANFKDSNLSVEKIARQFNFSKRYIFGLFENEPTTAAKYIQQKRLALSQQLLDNPLCAHQTIGDIATICGFSSEAHFGRVFKQQTGMSPRAYRLSRLQTIQSKNGQSQ